MHCVSSKTGRLPKGKTSNSFIHLFFKGKYFFTCHSHLFRSFPAISILFCFFAYLQCSFGHCQTTFHPTCARSAGFYMTVRTNGDKLQHKAYCEKHSIEQKAKVYYFPCALRLHVQVICMQTNIGFLRALLQADSQKHGMEEFKSLKQVRVSGYVVDIWLV